MEQSYLNKILAVFEIAYPYYFAEKTKDECAAFVRLYTKKLSKYEPEVVISAVDAIIETSKYMPSLSEVIEKCESQKRIIYKKKIDLMYQNGYFKTDEEYGKALMWLFEEKPIIPEWLKLDMNKYQNKLINGKEVKNDESNNNSRSFS